MLSLKNTHNNFSGLAFLFRELLHLLRNSEAFSLDLNNNKKSFTENSQLKMVRRSGREQTVMMTNDYDEDEDQDVRFNPLF